jgi:beta-lactamase regulating signal transducer with metallopeptidase domain
MRVRRTGIVVVLAVAVVCVGMNRARILSTSWAQDVPIGALFLVLGAMLVAGTTLAIVTIRVRRHLALFQAVGYPPELREAAVRTASRRIECLDTPRPVALCVGLIHPTVCVSTGLVTLLRPDQLDVVLIHEGNHATRREPLRRLVVRSLAAALSFVPLVEWWAAHRIERAELRADSVAIALRGQEAVAGALLAVGDSNTVDDAVSFAGVAEARAAVLLGDQGPVRHAPIGLWVWSLLGSLAAFVVSTCIVEQVARLGG